LSHTKAEWAGLPFQLLPWQRELIEALFETRRADGLRQYRQAYVEVPRKNGKTELAAGVALYLLLADEEPGAQIYSAAADRDQAALCYNAARVMVEANPKLSAMCKIYRRAIEVPSTGSVYRVLSADAHTKHGFDCHGIIFDELHAQPNRELYDVLHTSIGARRQPLEFMITTAGVYDTTSICWEIHDYAEKVREGVIEDPAFLGVIFGADKDADWQDPAVWAKANPSLGQTIKLEYLEAEAKRATESPAYENTFRRLHLDQWTEQATRWLQMHVWDDNSGDVSEAPLVGRRCFAGLDLSTTTDISALELLFPGDEEDEPHRVLSYFWVPEEGVLQRSRRDRVPYDLWVRDGYIEATEGNVVDYDVIRERINELGDRFDIQEIAIDRWNSTQLQTQLLGDGFEVVPFGQGFASMAAPTKELDKLLRERSIRHGGNPVLRWMASNVAVKGDAAGNWKPAKDKSSERIDGIVALIMALGRAMVVPPPQQSVYETRGVLSL